MNKNLQLCLVVMMSIDYHKGNYKDTETVHVLHDRSCKSLHLGDVIIKSAQSLSTINQKFSHGHRMTTSYMSHTESGNSTSW